MDSSRLYLNATAQLPCDPVGPETYRVAVFKGPAKEDDTPEWFVCGPHVKLDRIRVQYAQLEALEYEEGENVYLVQDGRLITDPDAEAKDYDADDEKIIVLEAFVSSELPESLRSSIAIPQSLARRSDDPGQQPCLASITENLSLSRGPQLTKQTGNLISSLLRTVASDRPFDAPTFDKNLEALQKVIQHSTLASKESAVERCLPLLQKSKEIVSAQPASLGLKGWMQRITNLHDSYHKPKTLIGILGQTGAGKSSLANALIDEEQLVPTSGMQACTAAPTQIAFNDLSNSRYRAEIEFVQPAEWKMELETFLEETENASDDSPQKPNAEISSTVARIHAAHRQLRKIRVTEEDTHEAMSKVEPMLGTIEIFESDNATDFSSTLGSYIFTKHNISEECEEDPLDAPEELWPLVKLVRIYTKSEALATGAVLVDLPGLGDSNAARANIARDHMKDCDFLWILSAIKRAVDDETAKKLLGSSLNTQMIMDGSLETTTFICTGTDDIRVTEFSHLASLIELKMKAQEGEEEVKGLKLEVKALQRDVDRLTKTEGKCEQQITDLEDRISRLDNIATQARKRPASPEQTESAKKQKLQEESFVVVDDGERDKDAILHVSPGANANQSSKMLERLEERLQEVQRRKNDQHVLKNEKRDLLEQKSLKLSQVEAVVAESREELTSTCIQERNKVCKRKIRADFAECIRGLDEREMQRKDPHGFDPDFQTRDYDALGKSLPVFCTSSIAYQKLQGRYVKDRNIVGFRDVKETEIPDVKAHCVRLTEPAREAACHRFLVEFCDLANSLKLWAQTCENLYYVASDAALERETLVDASLNRLEEALKNATQNAIGSLRSELDRHVYKVLPIAIAKALEKAPFTCEKWEALRYRTYKATCRRKGVFRDHDWNQALLDPIVRKVARGWDTTFAYFAPRIMQSLGKHVNQELADFEQEVGRILECVPLDVSDESLQMQTSNFKTSFDGLCTSTTGVVSQAQKEISREFKDLIESAMDSVYRGCYAESGRGAFRRMKERMARHISEKQMLVFNQSSIEVKEKLNLMIEDAEAVLLGQVPTRIFFLRDDYHNVLGDASREEDESLRETRRTVARSVMHVFRAIEQIQQGLDGNGRE